MRAPNRTLTKLPLACGLLALSGPFLGSCASAGHEKGLRAYQRHDYELAVESWTPAAEEGDADAQFCLGNVYEDGQGVEVDYALAHEYYLRAATQGHTDAQLNLGRMYAQGLGVEPSFERARHWFERAAAEGSPMAHRNLGVMYLKGYGVDRDLETARASFERAAEEDAFSAKVLASLHDEGLVEGGPELGGEWLAAAAAAGDVDSQTLLGTRLLQRGEEVEAARWLMRAADAGSAPAQLLYGWMLQSGRGVPRDVEAARTWIETAASAGDPAAQVSVAFGIVSSAGRSPSREDVRDAALWMHAAARAGLAQAQYNLGLMTIRGQGVKRSYREGVRWFQAAAEQGFQPARDRLESLGERVPRARTTAADRT